VRAEGVSGFHFENLVRLRCNTLIGRGHVRGETNLESGAPVHDDGLEQLERIFDTTNRPLTTSAVLLSREVASEVAQIAVQRRPRHRFWRIGVLAPVGLSLVALTGAGTYAAYQLSVPPFVETGPGVERVSKPVPIEFVTDSGLRVSCGWWAEFRNVTRLQRDQLDAMATNRDWRGYGQRIYDELPARNRKVRDWPGETFGKRIEEDLASRALAAAPGLTRGSASSGEEDAVLTGSTIRCEYPDGRR